MTIKSNSDFEEGFEDGLKDRRCRAISLDYVAGYKRGREVRQINNPRYLEFEE